MARRLFHVPAIHRGTATIEGDDAKHLTRVLRVEPGQIYQISDNESLYLAEVEEAHKGRVVFRVTETLAVPEPRYTITLCAALIKFDHFEWMLEKVTELGVSRIVPVLATRTEAGLDRAAAKRMERWRKILLEASQQSRRVRMPEIVEPVPFKQALAEPAELRLFADESGGTPLVTALASAQSMAILVGPEGGWTEAERLAATATWAPVSLGENVFRAETAAMAALAVMVAVAHARP
ncbi:MAG: RsmE family RNA methyltransferase [Acidobacteria bacterium]|nr:RsmE family RNA methyltransferase [Acidobacteriota bacterium]